jgi:hypothetical protein
MTPNTRTTPDPDSIIPTTDDPGGAHAKGFSAETGSPAAKLPDPIPLADAPAGGIHVPERDPGVAPTGRSEPKPYDPNDQIVSDE